MGYGFVQVDPVSEANLGSPVDAPTLQLTIRFVQNIAKVKWSLRIGGGPKAFFLNSYCFVCKIV